MQTAILIGNVFSPYYSCVKLEITGGNPDLRECQTDKEPITYNYHKSGGPHIVGHFLHAGKWNLKVDIILMTWTWKQLLKSCKLFLNMEYTMYVLTNIGCQQNAVTCNDVNSGNYCKRCKVWKWDPGTPSKFKCGTHIFVFLYCFTYIFYRNINIYEKLRNDFYGNNFPQIIFHE